MVGWWGLHDLEGVIDRDPIPSAKPPAQEPEGEQLRLLPRTAKEVNDDRKARQAASRRPGPVVRKES